MMKKTTIQTLKNVFTSVAFWQPMVVIIAITSSGLVLGSEQFAISSPVQVSSEQIAIKKEQSARPNFLLVVADDLGWSDIGAFGGEIRTPNLDALAQRGTMMTDFYVAPTCSPTRSMLLTGVDNHLAGVGTMVGLRAPNQNTQNYDGQLHSDVVTLAEALKYHGYQTMISGKWHLAIDEQQRAHRRGFDRSFVLANGGASHFANQLPISPQEIPLYLEEGEPAQLPDDFYSSIAYTDKLLAYLSDREDEANQPFFAYLSYTAPHDPLQVPDDWRDRYQGAYDQGPHAIRKMREKRIKSKSMIPADAELWQLPNFPSWLPLHRKPWQERSAEQRAIDSRPMEIYAAMIELMDEQFGRVVDALRESGELDNTYILFLSDNGASAFAPMVYPGNTKEWLSQHWDNSPENAGAKDAFTTLGQEWANMAVTPWRLSKGQVGEGGIRSPLIVAGPLVAAGKRVTSLAHVTDITPTLFEIAGIDSVNDPLYQNKILPQGVSLLPAWAEGRSNLRNSFATELFGSRALRRGQWKLSFVTKPQGTGEWELFDLASDPGETANIAERNPAILQSMLEEYEAYRDINNVIHPDMKPILTLRRSYGGECNWWCELRFKIHDPK